MLLKDWLNREGLRPYLFAKKIGMAPPNIYRCLAGTQKVSTRYALKIEAITGGEVSRTEILFPEDYIDKDEDGNEQLRSMPKIHFDLAKGIELHGKESVKIFDEEKFSQWAFNEPVPPSMLYCCVKWAELHNTLKRIDHMKLEESIIYMKQSYIKHLRSTELRENKKSG